MDNTPAKLGTKKFFHRYLDLAPERFERYFYGQWNLTKRLEDLGNRILKREVSDEVNLLLFLIDVAVWKEPHESQAKEMIKLVSDNSYYDIKSAFNKVWHALAEQKDEEAIDAIGSLRGFGKGDGSRKIASAVLRFLSPERFAVVDYRNWFLLSNTEGQYFEKPLLQPLGITIDDTKGRPINTKKYLEYLHVVRELAEQNGISPAEVDTALFAFSDEIRPLSVTPIVGDNEAKINERIADRYSTVKYQKMVEVVMRVVNDNKKKGHSRAAITLEKALKKCRTPYEIMNMCYNMTTRASYMDRNLAMSGTMTLSHIMKELERIYRE